MTRQPAFVARSMFAESAGGVRGRTGFGGGVGESVEFSDFWPGLTFSENFQILLFYVLRESRQPIKYVHESHATHKQETNDDIQS